MDEAPRPLAGGQDLLTTMKDYTTRPARIVNLKSIRGLNRITLNARGLTIGALVTLTELEEHAGVRKSFPGLAEAAHSVATPQIRNLGTVGGNLSAPALLVLPSRRSHLFKKGRLRVLRGVGRE